MKAIANLLVRRRWPLLAFLFFAGSVLLVTVDDNGGVTALAIVFFVAVAVALAGLILNLAGHDPEAAQLAADLAPSPAGGALLARWLRRSRYYRFVGGSVGLVAGFGFVTNGQYVPIIVGLLGGVAAGGALAELHLLRRRDDTPRDADLAIRRIADYVRRVDVVSLGGIAAIAALLAVVGLAGVSVSHGETVAWALAALGTAAAASGLQRLVVMRARPALSAELRSADDLLRRLAAGQGFTRPAMALGVGCVAESISSLGPEAGFGGVAFVLWLLALWWYSSSRPDREHLMQYKTVAP